MTDSDSEDSSRRHKRIIQLLTTDRTVGYKQVLRQLQEARELVHEEVSRRLEIPLREYLEGRPQGTIRERQNLSRELNADLRSLGIAIKCPRTGEPGILQIDSGYRPQGRYQILIHDDKGYRRTVSATKLPVFELRPNHTRREPMAEYWAKYVESRSPHRPGKNS